jgi:cytochrome c-type biogenesis protein CcmH
MTRCLLLLLILTLPVCAQVKQAPPDTSDPVLEQRVTALAQQLRCLVCQNETLADSQADLAADLRNQIREQMKAGKSDKEILAFLTQRYGDFVLYKPPVKPTTYLLWFGPFILLVGGAFILFTYVKRRREAISDRALSDSERRLAEQLLEGTQKETG